WWILLKTPALHGSAWKWSAYECHGERDHVGELQRQLQRWTTGWLEHVAGAARRARRPASARHHGL
ncbi:MAG: hypothetical protein ABIR48_07805, partial [Gammaproteobacteria bacterium]